MSGYLGQGEEPFGFEEVDVTSAAVVNLTESEYTDDKGNLATRAVIIVKTANIRWRTDGGDPTTSVGMPVGDDKIINLTSSQAIKKFAAIAESTSAKLHVQYLR